jgi:hypothetical protein
MPPAGGFLALAQFGDFFISVELEKMPPDFVCGEARTDRVNSGSRLDGLPALDGFDTARFVYQKS